MDRRGFLQSVFGLAIVQLTAGCASDPSNATPSDPSTKPSPGEAAFPSKVSDQSQSWIDIREGLIIFCGAPDQWSEKKASSCPTNVWNIATMSWNDYDIDAINQNRGQFDLHLQRCNPNLRESLQILVENLYGFDNDPRNGGGQSLRWKFQEIYEAGSRQVGREWPRVGLAYQPARIGPLGQTIWPDVYNGGGLPMRRLGLNPAFTAKCSY